jgi:hypothetical protein
MKYFVYVDEDGTVHWGLTLNTLMQRDGDTVKVTGRFDARDPLPLDEGWVWAVIETEVFGPRALVAYQPDTDAYRFVAPLKKCGLYEVQPQCFRVIHLDVTISSKGFEPRTEAKPTEDAATTPA